MKMMSSAPRTFVKQHGTNVERDWLRIQRLSDACEHVAGLRTARPLWMDPARGRIGYERLDGLRPVARDLAGLPERMHRIGAALFHLHRAPVAADAATAGVYPLSTFGLPENDLPWLSGLPEGLFHGDCWHGNFFEHDGELVVLDPLPNPHLFREQHLLASGAIDLATMYMSLPLCQPLVRQVAVPSRRYAPAGEALLAGYFEALGSHAARPAVLRLARTIAVRFVASYKARLSWPIWRIKTMAGNNILRAFGASAGWGAS